MGNCQDVNEYNKNIKYCRGLHCTNTVGTFSCGCRDGFKILGHGFDASCNDVDECQENSTCTLNAKCHNNEGGYTCKCDEGYHNDSCVDFDECYFDTAECDSNAFCLNTVGSYK